VRRPGDRRPACTSPPAGVGTLGIVDHDRVDLVHLQRQLLFATSDVGAGKAPTAQTRLRALNPDISVVAYELELRGDNALELLRPYDLVLGRERPVWRRAIW